MEEISSSPTSRVASLTPDDREPQEQGSGSRAFKAKSATAAGRPKSAGDHLEELAEPESQDKHQLDELA